MLGTWGVRGVAAGVLLVLAMNVGSAAQTRGAAVWNPIGASGPVGADDVMPWITERAERERLLKREQRLAADTERMAVLAAQLQDAIGKGAGKTLSVQAIRQAEEMEKLARGVKKALKE